MIQPLANYGVRTSRGNIHYVSDVWWYISPQGTLTFYDKNDEMVESYSPTGWERIYKR